MIFSRTFSIRFNLAAAVIAALFALSGCNAEGDKAKHLERGENYLKTRQFQEAALEFRSAIEIDKNSGAAHYGLANAFEGQERFAETVTELRKTVELDAQNVLARFKLGNYYLLTQPPEIILTEKLIADIFAVDADSIEGRILQATLFNVQKKSVAETVAVLNSAIALDPRRVETYLALARFYASRTMNADAEQTFQKALQVNAKSAKAEVDYALFLDYLKRTDEAETHFRRAAANEADNRDALKALAEFYVSHTKFDRAEAVYTAISNLEPNRPESRAVLADFYVSVGKNAEAIRVYQEILAAKPNFILGRARLGDAYLRGGDEPNANAQANEILNRNGRDVAGLLLRARIRMRNNDAETAIKDLQEVLKQEPSNKFALYFMADAQFRAGKLEQARDFLVTLERFHPDYLYSKRLRSEIDFAAGAPENARAEAGQLLEKLSKKSPDKDLTEKDKFDLRLNALTARGSANLQLGKTDEAKNDFSAAQVLAPNSPSVYLNLAKVSLKNKNSIEAANFYHRALELDANNFDALSGLVNVKVSGRQFAEAHSLVESKNSSENAPNLKAALLFLQSQIFLAEQKPEAAETALRTAIETDANYFPSYLSYAALLADQKQIDRAAAQYRAALAANEPFGNPNAANLYTLIGLLEDERQNVAAAAENYKKALQLNPNQAIAANNLGWLYAANGAGNLDEAVAIVQPLTEKYPNEAGYADTLGWILLKKGAAELAVVQLRRAVALEERAAAEANRQTNPAYRMRLNEAMSLVNKRDSGKLTDDLANPTAKS